VKAKDDPGENSTDVHTADRTSRMFSCLNFGEQKATLGTDRDYWSFTLWTGCGALEPIFPFSNLAVQS
jgi:hypothetical protein